MLWSRTRALGAAILVGHASAFVLSWYKVIILLSLCLSSGALQHTVSLNFFFELRYFGPDFRLARTKPAIPIWSVQNADCRLQTADCRPGTKCRLGSKCRLQTGYKMQTENLYCFFVWYVITFHLTTDRASRNAFPRPSFTIICTIVEYSLPVSLSQSFLI